MAKKAYTELKEREAFVFKEHCGTGLFMMNVHGLDQQCASCWV